MVKKIDRKKINFMVSKEIMMELNQLIPSGERSDFVNEALKEALIDYARRKAIEEMDKIAQQNLNISTAEFLKTKHEGLL